MKTQLIFYILLFAAQFSITAQQIEIEGSVFKLENRTYKLKDLKVVMAEHPDALALVKQAQTNNVIGQILGGSGGFLVGWTIGQALSGSNTSKPPWTLGFVGAGCILGSMAFASTSRKHAQTAVKLYNETVFPPQPSLSHHTKFELRANGLYWSF